MKRKLFFLGFFPLCFALSVQAAGEALSSPRLTLDAPKCENSVKQALPRKYYTFAEQWSEFSWVRDVRSSDLSVGGSGYERIDGSGMYNWFIFSKLDINNDSVCDWFVVSSAPYSTGGDSGILNTIYLGSKKGWKRIGASIPDDQPDILGAGNSSNEQGEFTFSSEDLVVVYDEKARKSYFIGYFNYRADAGRLNQRGYHIYVWNAERDTLEELDKWEPNSTAEQVYDWFKEYGAVDPTATGVDRLVEFDPREERRELSFGCRDEDLTKRSPGFAAKCESMALTD